MTDTRGITARNEALRALFEKHMGVRASTFERAVLKAGRRLPRRLRHQAEVLIEAEGFAAHPKLERRIDSVAVRAAHRSLEAHLKTLNHSEVRRTQAINMAAGVAFNLLVVGVLVVVFLRWRGLV